MKAMLAILAVAIALVGTAGPQALGRLALWTGLDRPALWLLTDPASRGVAQYRRGDYAAADESFAKAGRSQTFNRGLSLAATGDYPLSVAYFDAMLFANPADAQARQNRDLVNTMITPVRGDTPTDGRLAAVGGIESNELSETDLLANASGDGWDRRPVSKGIAASDEWLDTISDDPGEFLKLRLRAEYDRRAQLGLIRPREENEW